MTKILRAIVAAGLIGGTLVVALGVLARWYPRLDIVNNGLPVLAVGSLGLLALAFATGTRKLIGGCAILLAVTLGLLVLSLPGAAPQAPQGAERFIRVVTFNLWGRNDHHLNRVTEFLTETNADAVVLEEVRGHHAAFIESLAGLYPYRLGDNGLFILSKYPILAEGRIDRGGEPFWMSLIIRWARLDVNGEPITLAGVHLARPFYPELQQADIMALTNFVREQTGPLILAGDLNMTPWTVKLRTFTDETGLGRFNTFQPTWPVRWRRLPLLPLLPIDHVFASPQFTKISTTLGPRLDSDHRPVIADIAFVD